MARLALVAVSRVIGFVVQPEVEFDHQSAEHYRPERAAALLAVSSSNGQYGL
ncbi:class II D-tagatose-bisphosphate aldolase non-catalytic subunit [Sodalis-like endosymbiont of Proechinophthirus fluctus]|uniref:class II D-tagatose-bisphosphate aldolase non-catalytic subunit n=1 Tax=Sodalis-like endosymbiont of Proechinophthirus fluctus TaxID=1462730 RepID=UPI000AEE3113|nr:class II D-tagatose-bisphosphate aldolase, non-catalytic subunit [Sodalis-like endosymbiont of Proechinophthirus fluctus]